MNKVWRKAVLHPWPPVFRLAFFIWVALVFGLLVACSEEGGPNLKKLCEAGCEKESLCGETAGRSIPVCVGLCVEVSRCEKETIDDKDCFKAYTDRWHCVNELTCEMRQAWRDSSGEEDYPCKEEDRLFALYCEETSFAEVENSCYENLTIPEVDGDEETHEGETEAETGETERSEGEEAVE